MTCTFRPADKRATIRFWRGDPANAPDTFSSPEPKSLPKRWWKETVTTSGTVSEERAPFVVDKIGLPQDNPWGRKVRPTGIAFFEDGRAAIVTTDGDVWIASGFTAGLERIEWRRVAAGLNQPQAIQIRDGEIFVFSRSGLEWVALGHEGEAGYHFNFCGDFSQSAETRDFALDMVVRPDGGFFLVKGGQQNSARTAHSGRVLSVFADGQTVEVFATGLRNGFLGIDPNSGRLFSSDQQGHWTPSTPFHWIRKGGYYGFEPAAPLGVPEPQVTPPLTWIPHRAAQSGVGLVLVNSKKMGSLSGSMLMLDYYRPGILKTYWNGDEKNPQGAVVPLIDVSFDSPLLRGAVNPVDGMVYLVGFQVWGTKATEISGLRRLRYIGRPDTVPTDVVATDRGVLLSFDEKLDPSSATVTAKRWNYQRTENYGSGHFLRDGSPGEEYLVTAGAHFSTDRKSVLIHVPDMEPIEQMEVTYSLKTAHGIAFENAAYLSIRNLPKFDPGASGFGAIDFAKVTPIPNAADPKPDGEPTAERGEKIYATFGCAACHSTDGTTLGKSGPSWKGISGSERDLLDGSKTRADDAYLREAILDPTAKVLAGYDPKDVGMPSYRGILSEGDVDSLVLFIRTL